MDALTALKTALEREHEGQKTYREAAARATTQKGKKLLEWLASEENGHITLLKKSIQQLGQGSGWPRPDGQDAEKYISEPIKASEIPSKPQIMGNLAADAPELEVIKKAIQAEEADAGFYEQMARSLTDGNGRSLIQKLAEVERGHQRLLEEEHEWVRHSKDLFTLHKFLEVQR